MFVRVIVLLTLMLITTYFPFSAAAQGHSLENLKEKIQVYVTQQLPEKNKSNFKITVGYLDPRLQLASCDDKDLQLSIPRGQQAPHISSILVQCQNNSPWSLYVPVKIQQSLKVVVTSRAIARGMPVQESDLELVEAPIEQLNNGYYEHPAEISGMIAKRPLAMGMPITPNALELPVMMHKGDIVTITAKNANISVNMEGVALGNGSQGESISVQNRSSGNIIQAKISGPKQVSVIL